MRRRHNCKVMIIVNAATNLANFRNEIIEALLADNYEVIIVSPAGKRLLPYKQKAGCKVIEIAVNRHGKNPIEEMSLFIKYLRVMKENRPICVLTYTIKPNIYGGLAARFLRIPYLVNITGLGVVFDNKNMLQKTIVLLYRRVMKHATCVFFQNKTNRNTFIRLGIGFPCSEIIPGSGVNLEENALEPYPSEDEPLRFIFIARIMKDKGIHEYVNAARIIRRQYPQAEFHVIGNCEYGYEKIIEKWVKQGDIVYHGAQPDVHSFIKKSHALIHPSFYMEGMSNVCLEAAATGRPVLTTNWLGCRETVDDGKTGYIFAPQNVTSLVRAIKRFNELSYGEKVKMGLLGRKKMENEFDRRIVVKAYMKEINRLAEY